MGSSYARWAGSLEMGAQTVSQHLRSHMETELRRAGQSSRKEEGKMIAIMEFVAGFGTAVALGFLVVVILGLREINRQKTHWRDRVTELRRHPRPRRGLR